MWICEWKLKLKETKYKSIFFNMAIDDEFVIFPFQILVTLMLYFGFGFCLKFLCQHFGASQLVLLI